MDKHLLEESLEDIREDIEELIFLFSSSLKQLQTFRKDLEKQKKHLLSFEIILNTTQEYEKKYRNIIDELRLLHRYPPRNDSKGYQHNSLEVKRYYDLYRSWQPMIAGLITSTDYQSPTFNHSITSLAGRQTGKIQGNYSDYKRDQHLDAKEYALAFRDTYIDGLWKFPIHTYLVNSGMAALTTILNFLEMERKITGPILLGSSSYFQNKELIKKLFTGVIEVHEHDTKQIQEIIRTKHPAVYFFDSLCNSHDIAVPNLKEIIDEIKQTTAKDVYIIIDNTCLAFSFQPLQLLGKFPKHIHMIIFESMNKYYQFGMDRTMGGIIYAWGKDTEKLFFARQHSGTIISDTGCAMLPQPNKKMIQKRFTRHERNAKILFTALNQYQKKYPKNPLETLVYPTLASHPAQSWAIPLTFHGSFFTFSWKTKYATIKTYKKFISTVLQEAKKQKVAIVQGTSFGMNTSRIYLTAQNTKYGKPFVRFSVGTENRYEIEKIKDVLIAAIKRL